MKFSVVIPVYNKSNTIADALDSVLSQTYSDFEIVIVDDGSKDDLKSVTDKYLDRDNIKLITQENGGVSVARNTGIKNSQGDFICFLDADDQYLNNHLEVLDGMIKKYPECSYFATSHITVYPDGTEKESGECLKKYGEDVLCNNLFQMMNDNNDGIIHTNSMCIKKDVITENGIYFEPGERIGEDTDMWFRVALRCAIAISTTATTVYRREYSTATAQTSNTLTWRFAKRIDDIESMDVSGELKKACIKLIDRYKLKCCRDMLCADDKKSAFGIIKKVRYRTLKYYLTLILCLLPLKLSKSVLAQV